LLLAGEGLQKVQSRGRFRGGEFAMAGPRLLAVGRPEVVPFPITSRLRSQLVYFMTPGGTEGLPVLGPEEFWFAAADTARWLDEGVFHLVSPLGTAGLTEVELSEEQEGMLRWLKLHGIEHVRVLE
jgi:hypothetical protein